MIYQKYFKYKYLSFFTVINCDENQEDIVVLIPGFTQNGCDIDYFMKELSFKLNLEGYATLIFEPIGHGDSYGDLSDWNKSNTIECIKMIGDYINNCFTGNKYLVSRGIFSNLIIDNTISLYFNKTISINPLRVNNPLRYFKKDETGIILLEDLFLNENSKYILRIMGAKDWNLKCQYINSTSFFEILNISYSINKDKNIIICTLDDTNDPACLTDIKIINNMSVKEQAAHSFIRSANWQNNLQNFVIKQIKRINYENSISDKKE